MKTQIIATIGPATESYESMLKLLHTGVDIFRFNFSHGNYDWFEKTFATAREASKKIKKQVKILLDTKGPEIRTGDIADPMHIKKGDILIFTTEKKRQDPKKKIIWVNYNGILKDVAPGDSMEIDNGLFRVKIEAEGLDFLRTQALDDAVLGSRKHINLPGIRVHLPTISAKDQQDILFGLEQGVDMIALSFVRSAQDIMKVQDLCRVHAHKPVQILGKIENMEGVENFDEILEISDGIMVARGDLGVELPFEQVPSLQKIMLKKANTKHKFSIVATQMLESMTHCPVPTRAEVSDVATAVWEHASAVMLSGETATGKYPLKAVGVMQKIVCYTEHNRASVFV